MRDPTREEMLKVLIDRFGGLRDPGSDDDAEIAMYWFATYWHGGQDSNLYSVLSTSPYRPGPMAQLETEGEAVGLMFAALEDEYTEVTYGLMTGDEAEDDE